MSSSTVSKPPLPKILLLTDEPPNRRDGNRHQLKPLVEKYSSSLIWYSMKSPLFGFELADVTVPFEHGHYLSRPRGQFWRSTRLWLNSELWSRYLSSRAIRFGKENKVSVVWAVIEGNTLSASIAVSRELRVPLMFSVMDDPLAICIGGGRSPLFCLTRALRFKRIMQRAAILSVIGRGMQDYYHEKYRVDPMILYSGIDPKTALPQQALDRSKAPVIIGSVGRIYPNLADEWSVLIGAVRLLNTRYGVGKFKILHIGDLQQSFEAPEVEVTGWLEGEDFDRELRRFDLCLSTLSFAERHKLIAATSFPTKIRSYIKAQRPIVILAPAYGSVTKFVDEYQCGVTCTMADAQSLADCIRGLVFEEGRYEQALVGMSTLLDTFSEERFFQSFENMVARALGESAAGDCQ